MVNTVFEKRRARKELFHRILEHRDEYDEDSVLMDLKHVWTKFCFLLHTFNGIFEHSDVLVSILQDKKLDVQFCPARAKEIL